MKDKPSPTGPVPVRVFLGKDMVEAQLAVAFLEESGVPARVENPLSHMTLSVLEPVIDGSEGVSVVVSSDRVDDARAALEEFRKPRGRRDDEEE